MHLKEQGPTLIDLLIVCYICSYAGILAGINGIVLFSVFMIGIILLAALFNGKASLNIKLDMWKVWGIYILLNGIFCIQQSYKFIIVFVLGLLILYRNLSVRRISFIFKLIKIVSVVLAISIIIQAMLPDLFYTFAKKWFYYSNQFSAVYYAGYNSHQYSGLFFEVSFSAFILSFGYSVYLISILNNKHGKTKKLTILNIFIACVLYYAVWLTKKRSFILILIFVTLFMLYEFLSKKPAMLLFIVLFGICFMLLSGAMDSIISFIAMILSRGTGEGLNLTGREDFWRVAIDMFLKNPIFGTGVNTYDNYFNASGIRDTFYSFAGAHNVYMQVLGESGMVGLVLCIMTFVTLFKKCFAGIKICTRNSLNTECEFFYICISMLIIYTIYGLSGNVLHQPQQMLVLFLLGNIILNTHKNIRENEV